MIRGVSDRKLRLVVAVVLNRFICEKCSTILVIIGPVVISSLSWCLSLNSVYKRSCRAPIVFYLTMSGAGENRC